MKRLGNTLYDIICQYTGDLLTYNKAIYLTGGNPVTDNDCDGIIYRKLGNEYFKLNFSSIYIERFGAKGGTNDDTIVINKAIDTLSKFSKGCELVFKNDLYSSQYIVLKRGVSLTGTGGYFIGSSIDSKGTTLKAINTTFQDSFIYYENEHSFNAQNGEIDGLPKSSPELKVKQLFINANRLSKYALKFTQCWGFSILNCKILGGYAYSLNITDCNEYVLNENQIQSYLSISNADFIETNNDIAGRKLFPAFMSDRSGLGTRTTNKIYLGGNVETFYKYNVTSINDGIFTFEPINFLTKNPNYKIYQSGGTVSFNEDTQEIILNSQNGESVVIVATLNDSVLVPGCQYKLTGTVNNSGSSSNRTIRLTCGNVSQQYGIVNVGQNTSNFEFTFTFNPLLNTSTSPLKITVEALDGSNTTGSDSIKFSNVKITQVSCQEIEGIPVVFRYPDTASNSLMRTYPHSEVFYPKFLSPTTMVLYPSLSTYFQNGNGYLRGTYSNLIAHSVEIPNAVWFLSGAKQGHSSTNVSNKVEDIRKYGIVLNGVYNNVFSGTKFSKGIDGNDVVLFSCIKGATQNTIVGNTISSRINATPTDTTYIGIYCDKYSGKNLFNNQTLNANYLDILDEFEGTKSEQNEYIAQGGFRYIKKPIDYNYNRKRLKLVSSKIGFVHNSTCLFSSQFDFALLFKNVRIDSQTGDCLLFQNKKIDTNLQQGRLLIKVDIEGRLIVTIGSNLIISSPTNTIKANVDYDILIQKNALNEWQIWIDGLLVSSSVNNNENIATEAGTISYIGCADAVQNGNLYLSDFAFFSDSLSESEIKTIFTKNDLNELQPIVLLNSKTSTTDSFTSISNNGTATQGVGLGIVNDSLLLSSQMYSNYVLAVSSSDTKNQQLRVSLYCKSDSFTKFGVNRDTNLKFFPVTNNWKKITGYLSVNKTQGGTEQIGLTFGDFIDGAFGKEFVTKQGTINVDYLKVSINKYPCLVHLNFQDEIIESTIKNRLNNSDIFYYYDGLGGFYWEKDTVNNKLVLYKNASPSSNIGFPIFEFDSYGNVTLQSAFRIYATLFAKSGNALLLGTEGANSIMMAINNAVNAQMFGDGRFVLGNVSINPTSAQFTVNSTTKGSLIPRMTKANRLAIVLPEEGLKVYQIQEVGIETEAGEYVYKKTGWTKIV